MKVQLVRCLVSILAVAALAGCQDDAARVQEHLDRADGYAEEESWPEAIIEYKSALQLAPNSADAHHGLSQAYLQNDQLRQGYWELRETVRLDPSRLDARMQFGQLSRLAGEFDEALEAYRKAREVTPDQGAALLVLGNFLRKRGEREAAEPLFRELTEKEPSFASYVAWGGFLTADAERSGEAEAAYRKALELAEEDQKSLAYRTLASFYYRAERVGDAERVLREAIESRPQDLQLIYLLARFYRSQGRAQEADEMIQAATRARPDDVQPQLILSLYRGQQGDREGALAAAEAALAIDPTNLGARLRKAELLVEQGAREKRRELIAQGRSIVDAILAKDASNAEALFVRSKVQMADGKVDEAVTDLRRVIDLRAGWAQAHLMLGSALFARQDPLAARAELQRALEIDAGLVEGRRALARVQAALGENEAAVEEARKVLNLNTEDDGLRILVAQSLVRQRRLAEGLAELQRIPPERRSAEVLYAIGRIHRMEGRTQQARDHYLRALDERPYHPDLLRSLLELDQQERRIADSQKRIGAAVEANPDNPHLVHLSGMVSLLAGDARQAETQLRRAISLDPNQIRFYETLARYLQMTGRSSEMLSTYEKAIAARPDSAPLHLVVGTLHELQGSPSKAAEYYENAIRLDPQLAPAKNNLAYLMAESGENLDRALDLAQEAKALLPDNPNAADTLGWVLLKKGIPSAAIGYLQEADEGFDVRNPNFGVVRHHLAQAYEANGETAKARETLRAALSDLERTLAQSANAREPAWAADVRAMLDRLEAEG